MPGCPGTSTGRARDAYIDVVVGATDADFAAAPGRGRDPRPGTHLDLLEAQRWRLAMFAERRLVLGRSDPSGDAPGLRAAARAVRLVDGVAGTHLERRLVARLEVLLVPVARSSTAPRSTGMALADVDQPPPTDGHAKISGDDGD